MRKGVLAVASGALIISRPKCCELMKLSHINRFLGHTVFAPQRS